ncbi:MULTISPECIES: BA14K family protein [unclassified Rhizobium]|uniref:BA14K family protein n=1 Tax=unclassified Rhizobium TaxID=2613769 RepID=UPI001ADBE01C|nr:MULTISPECIES: BA14K family protein [unclassified Rhizobium]MBO9123658.1 BA14K family protein [Rhizobium sp. 16-488-2b]MBO9174190.1 BA14K family protein [Rhizobium sp. 16-488-2a]
MRKLAIMIVALATAIGGAGPSFAENWGDSHSVQSRGSFGDSGVRNGHFGNRCAYYRCGNRYSYDRRYDRRYYNHDYDRYHRHNDAGLIIGGLAAGALIGGLIASQPRAPRYVGNDHVSWCYNRYRSYRASDNTYQPNYGPRRQCAGP